MDWINENKFKVGIIYINLIFIMLVIKICYRIHDFNFILVTAVFLMAVLIYYFYSAVLKKVSHRFLVTSIIFFIASFYVYKNLMLVLNFISVKFVNNFNGINELLLRGANTEFKQFVPFIILFLPIIVIILLILYRRKLTEAVLFLNMLVIMLLWYLEYVQEIKSVLVIFIALSIFTYALNNHFKYLKQIQRFGVKNNLKFKSIFLYMIIFTLISAFIGFILPQNINGNYSQESMERWTNPFSPDPKNTIGSAKQGRYGLNTSGYSNTQNKLGGPLTLNDQLVFQVKSDKPLYLKGDVREVYTGKSWIKSEESYASRWDISDTETNKLLKDKSNITSITVIPVKINTNTMFVPYYTSKVVSSKGNVYFEAKGETFINSSKTSREYTVEFYDSDAVSEYIKVNYMYRDIIVSMNDNQQYLAYPEQITQRTKDLVKNIIKNLNTNKEKVEAIQTYLSKNYPYSLEVSEVPENQDFLDYFLFTEKKGYCTYFATAMTIMCRIAGVPARYVEGFKMSEPSINGVYDVTNEQAHAWTEVLYRGNPQLWVVKDPSPTALEERQRLQEEKKENEIVNLEENQDTSLEKQNKNQEEKLEEEVQLDGSSVRKAIDYRLIVVISIISIIALYIVVRVILFANKKKVILKHKSSIPLYKYCIKRLKKIGLVQAADETDRDFVTKIADRDFRDKMIILVDCVYEEFYGGVNNSNIDKINLYKSLEDYITKREKRVVYILNKYFI